MSRAANHEGLWVVELLPGFRITCPYVAQDPNCPSGPHPFRNCRCRAFRTKAAAYAYISAAAEADDPQGERE